MNGRSSLAWLVFVLLPGCGGTTTSLPLDRDASVDASSDDGASIDSDVTLSNDGSATNADAATSTGANDAAASPDAAVADAATGPIDGGAGGAEGGAADGGALDSGALDGGALDSGALDGGALDAGGPKPANDAAVPPGPSAGRVACGATTCDATVGEFCCLQADGTGSCQTSGGACDARGGVRRGCEKASDCLLGDVCCYDFSSSPASASCRGDCAGGGGTRVQACRSSLECTAGTCALHACGDAGSIQSCEPHTPECP